MRLSSPPIIRVAVAVVPIIAMSASTSVVMVTVAVPFFLLVTAVPAVLLTTAGTWFIYVALISATAVHLGSRMLVRGVTVLP